jgi:addiction module HigA family antidote
VLRIVEERRGEARAVKATHVAPLRAETVRQGEIAKLTGAALQVTAKPDRAIPLRGQSMAEYAAKRDPNRCPSNPAALLREVIPATGESKAEIAALLGISRQHLYDILKEHKPVSPGVAVRLGKLFRDGAGVWVRMQGAYDIWRAERELAAEIRKIPRLKAAAA